ncbi:MAG: flagellar basal-body MS-ring/collar protein FliF [Pseudomonadota bacterium]
MATDTERPRALQGLSELAPWRQIALLAAVAASVGFGVAIALWVQEKHYVPLHQVSPGNAVSVSEFLDAERFDYRLSADGVLLVASEELTRVEQALAKSGIASTGTKSLDFLKEDSGFGQTEYQETKRYQHALEEHLGETISRFQFVRSARVHLAIPKRSPFLRNQRAPSASVFVHFHAGGKVNPELVKAIAHTVAQGVEGLEPERVTISDEQGRLLSQPERSDEVGLTQTQWDVVRRIEDDKLQKVARLLTPIAGVDGFTAEVTVDVDFTRSQVAQETYNPDLPAARTRRLEEEESDAAQTARGVPGALSNQPAGDAVAPEVIDGEPFNANNFAAGNEPRHRRRVESVSNELDKTVVFREEQVGSVSRISIAVVLDDLVQTDGSGQTRRESWSPERIASITEQVKNAVGFVAERGDSVSVVNTRFVRAAPIEPPSPPAVWQQAWVWPTVQRIGIVLFILLMVFGVFRPLIRSLVNRDIVERQTKLEETKLQQALEDDVVEIERERRAVTGEFERNLSAVRQLVTDDPRRAANVLKDWVGEGGRG